MRRSELAALSIFDFDTRRKTLLIRHGKGNRSRVVPVGERAALWLGKYVDEARPEMVLEPDDGFLFVGRLGEPVNPTYLSQLVREYVVKAKIRKPGSCHLFRHTAAVLMLGAREGVVVRAGLVEADGAVGWLKWTPNFGPQVKVVNGACSFERNEEKTT